MPLTIRKNSFLFILAFILHSTLTAQVVGSVMNEVFKKTTLVPQATGLNDPWEITYASDGKLWITVAKDYKILRMDPATGTRDTVLNIAPGATGYLTAA